MATSGFSAGAPKTTAGDPSATNGLDAGAQNILNTLLQQLASGGTPQMQQASSARTGEVQNLETQRAGFSKEAAFADAQGLIAQTMRQALERLIPSINTGALGAGASQSSMRALLTQRAAENASQAAASEGIKAATNYGQVAGGISEVISRLLSVQDPSAQLLIQAIGAGRGATGGSSAGGRAVAAPPATGGSFGGGSQVAYAPQAPLNFGGGGGSFAQPNVFRQYETIEPPATSNIVGSTADTLRELAGDTSFRGYTF